jgi:hypothetical protein
LNIEQEIKDIKFRLEFLERKNQTIIEEVVVLLNGQYLERDLKRLVERLKILVTRLGAIEITVMSKN